MSLLSVVGDLAGSVLSGGVTSLLGVGLKSFFDFKNKKLDFEQALKMKEADAKIMQQEWEARSKVASIEAAGAAEVAATNAFAKSYDLEPKSYVTDMKAPTGKFGSVIAAIVYMLLGILDFVKGIIRPGMALYLTVFATMTAAAVRTELKSHPITDDQAYTIAMQVVSTTLYLWTTCVLWYFGARNNAPQKGA